MKGMTTLIPLVFFLLLTASCARTPADMAFVEQGEFIMGSDAGEDPERPERRVFVKAFYMDKFEVTNEAYRRFTLETKRKEPKDWLVHGYREETKDHPVVFVSYADALEYCKWAGKKRLPTEEEWEKAARGIDGRTYPWGMEFDKNNANTSLSGIVGVTKVGRYEKGKSPYGIYDMAGNVWEWTNSDYDGASKVVRGGAWGITHRFSKTSFKIGYPASTTINNLGFRCARD